MHLPAHRKGLAAVSLPLAALLVCVILSNRIQLQRKGAEVWEQRASAAVLEIRHVSAGLLSYGTTEASINARLDRIQTLVRDDPAQVRRLALIRQLVHKRLDELSERRDDTASLGSPLLELDAVYKAQEELLQRITGQERARQARLQVAITSSAALGLIGGLFAIIWFYRRTGRGGNGDLRLALGSAQASIWELEPDGMDAWIATVHAEDRLDVRDELERVLAEGGSFQFEYRIQLRGGELRKMAVRGHRHSFDHGQRLLGLVADVTGQKKTGEGSEALLQQGRMVRSVLDSMGDAVAVADENGKFLVFNPAAEQILERGEAAGGPAEWPEHFAVFLPDMVTPYPADMLPLARAMRGESLNAEELFVRPREDSEGKWLNITARPLRADDGSLHGGVVVFRDISARKRDREELKAAKQEAEHANQAKSEFLSRMSHELRTPLNSILGFAQLLELSELKLRQAENVAHILKGGYHLLELINEVLDLARVESGRLSLSPEPVRMREALKDALDLIRPLAAQQNVTISPDIAIRCARHVRADRQRLKQVLLNLLSNAVKFNRSGGSVVLSCEETPESTLRIEIADTGVGISPEGLEKLFTPFERLGADITGVEGTGLGLALSKRLVEAMGGVIGAESTPGVGSRFFIELALLEDPSEQFEKEGTPALAAADPEQHGTVLYIEDNLSNLRLMERILEHRPGVKLLSAMQAQLGLDLAQSQTPDWILLDLHLPDLSGEEVLRRLRGNPLTEQIPVTVVSADATPGQIDRLMAAGARNYLTKPLDVRKLLGLLEKTMQRGEAHAYAERNPKE